MRNIIVTVVSSFILLLVMSGVLADRAEAGTDQLACSVTIRKNSNVPPPGQEFEFLVEPSAGGDFVIDLFPGQEDGFGLNFGQSAVVSENVPPGWRLVDVDCESGPGISIIIDEDNNVLIDCLTVSEAFCSFFNVRTGTVPTLSEWGMITAAGGLMLVGVWFAIRRRRAFNS